MSLNVAVIARPRLNSREAYYASISLSPFEEHRPLFSIHIQSIHISFYGSDRCHRLLFRLRTRPRFYFIFLSLNERNSVQFYYPFHIIFHVNIIIIIWRFNQRCKNWLRLIFFSHIEARVKKNRRKDTTTASKEYSVDDRFFFLKKIPFTEYLIPLIYREETRNEGRDICKINCTWNIYVVAADVHSMYTAASNI